MPSFDRWYVDLSLVVFLTGLAVFVVSAGVSGPFRIVVVLPLVTVLPGYAVVAALFPRAGSQDTRTFDENELGLQNPLPTKEGIDPLERVVFSVVATLVIVPVVALVANFTPWGITLDPILFGVAGVTVLFALVGFVRRAGVPTERRYRLQPSQLVSNLSYTSTTAGFGTDADRRRLFNVALAVGVLLFATSIGYAVVNPPTGEGFTEFYVDTDNVTGDTQSMYPSQFESGESRTLPVNVTNQEHERVEYQVLVLVQRVDGTGEDAQVRDEQRVARRTVTLDHGETRTLRFQIAPSRSGSDLRIVLLLYRGGVPDDPSLDNAYRSLRLPIDVGGGGAGSRSSDGFDTGADADDGGTDSTGSLPRGG